MSAIQRYRIENRQLTPMTLVPGETGIVPITRGKRYTEATCTLKVDLTHGGGANAVGPSPIGIMALINRLQARVNGGSNPLFARSGHALYAHEIRATNPAPVMTGALNLDADSSLEMTFTWYFWEPTIAVTTQQKFGLDLSRDGSFGDVTEANAECIFNDVSALFETPGSVTIDSARLEIDMEQEAFPPPPPGSTWEAPRLRRTHTVEIDESFTASEDVTFELPVVKTGRLMDVTIIQLDKVQDNAFSRFDERVEITSDTYTESSRRIRKIQELQKRGRFHGVPGYMLLIPMMANGVEANGTQVDRLSADAKYKVKVPVNLLGGGAASQKVKLIANYTLGG